MKTLLTAIALAATVSTASAQEIDLMPEQPVTIPAACYAGLGAFAAAAGASFPVSVPIIFVAVAICSITAETVVNG